jgi:hypothetical protein
MTEFQEGDSVQVLDYGAHGGKLEECLVPWRKGKIVTFDDGQLTRKRLGHHHRYAVQFQDLTCGVFDVGRIRAIEPAEER